jgi:hypothetical protein
MIMVLLFNGRSHSSSVSLDGSDSEEVIIFATFTIIKQVDYNKAGIFDTFEVD